MNRFQGTIPDTFDKKCGLNNINFNGNELEGSIPPSLVHCRNMQVLDLGNNKIKDTFPRWLETLPEMQVLVLRSNKLHSFLPSSMVNHSFPELRILDLANNDLAGPLPKGYVENMKGMWNLDEQGTSSYMGTRNFSYHYSVSLTIKGFEIKLEKILTIFASIDLSNTMFVGEISSFVGQHNSLRGPNLSHNSFSGQIPESIGNLTQLEWLDLSSNKLNGQIPHKLADLTFLAFLNLSDNRLTGPTPQGRQFNTFENASYHGNIGLCGFPLSRGCNSDGLSKMASEISSRQMPLKSLKSSEIMDLSNADMTIKGVRNMSLSAHGHPFVFAINISNMQF
ncbi:receptor-like protein 9DC3 [Gossypium hirsutum]|uniref:Receptor-like protein 9DC3 n=1 Tax=Gossypium hirsutum TaxID=3635 RepID=A0A1U8KXB8_GOSHI|nr:receptor-like protein 9DC3 [Gossypium hirsutum]